jgi:hypothetical protein
VTNGRSPTFRRHGIPLQIEGQNHGLDSGSMPARADGAVKNAVAHRNTVGAFKYDPRYSSTGFDQLVP